MINDFVRKSFYLRQLEALFDHLSPRDMTENLEKAYGRELSGYTGEKKLPYYLHMVQKEKMLLYGVRLPWQKHFFQIDNLSIFQKKIVICEVKNLKGRLSINEANQLVQEHDDGKIEIYDNPLLQAKFQQEKLEALLHLHGFSFPPIHPIVVFTHSSANLNFHHPDMIPVQQLPVRIKILLQEQTINQDFNYTERRHLINFISSHHQERKVNVLDQFKIELRKTIRGVFCPSCQNVKAHRVYGTWQCPKCGRKDKMMHVQTLRNWVLIFGPVITNKQARWFLDGISIDLTKRLLKQLNCPSVGSYRDRKYDLSKLLD
ncbi:Nuclease-related domain-containing protein [Gracilibacillus orientalis]|uniref:Nuclease-related domain-containing protein n=1 Tax=Gracilibacillus orientalis TaxID=334253 RepID=A0A1I4HFP6_9BACI|nr:NERD domain-containing protein [Gracilibacillus orientalis]SFL40580.1 Nuclease-related domain-containing protein [Gracilibacillus orientalis]